MGSKSGLFHPEGVLNVSKPSEKVRGGPRGINGGQGVANNNFRIVIISNKPFRVLEIQLFLNFIV
jgi:hypothetical protein